MNCPVKSLERIRAWVHQDSVRLAELKKIPSKKLKRKHKAELIRLMDDTGQRLSVVSKELGDKFLISAAAVQLKMMKSAAAKTLKPKKKRRPPEL